MANIGGLSSFKKGVQFPSDISARIQYHSWAPLHGPPIKIKRIEWTYIQLAGAPPSIRPVAFVGGRPQGIYAARLYYYYYYY